MVKDKCFHGLGAGNLEPVCPFMGINALLSVFSCAHPLAGKNNHQVVLEEWPIDGSCPREEVAQHYRQHVSIDIGGNDVRLDHTSRGK